VIPYSIDETNATESRKHGATKISEWQVVAGAKALDATKNQKMRGLEIQKCKMSALFCKIQGSNTIPTGSYVDIIALALKTLL
jgi:hypothetical protein